MNDLDQVVEFVISPVGVNVKISQQGGQVYVSIYTNGIESYHIDCSFPEWSNAIRRYYDL